MKITNPDHTLIKDRGILRWAQSVAKAITTGLSFGQPTGTNVAGIYNAFMQDNLDGVLIRIGAFGGSEIYNWPGSNIGLAINHGLQRQPIGFLVCDLDAAATIYRTVTPPTPDLITLAITVSTTNATVYIF